MSIGGTEAWEDTIKVDARRSITNQTGRFELALDDRFDKWNARQWNDAVIITIDGTRVLKGRIDELDRDVDKKSGKTIDISGRDDGGALQDIETSKHYVNQDVNGIISDIIDTYNTLKTVGDPAISIGSILPAPGTISMSFQFKRKPLWDMCQEIANALGAPPALGGLDTFHDFYVDPFDAFFFEPVGTRSSGVNLGGVGGPEIKKRRWTIDSLPVKTDIWVWGDGMAGTIPLVMQPGYSPAGRADPWTEGNPEDFLKGTGVDIITTDSDCLIGSSSIKIITLSIFSTERGYWYMPFPFGAPYPPGGSKWTAQPPRGVLNAYNETSLTETMGEIAAIGFFYKADTPHNLLLEVKDIDSVLAQSEAVRIEKGVNWYAPEWNYVQLPFGPSANYKNMSDTDVVDWTSIQEIRFVFFNYPYGLGTIQVLVDGFRFIKPLVVRAFQLAAPTRRIRHVQETTLNSYSMARIYGEAYLENLKNPQQYYDILNIGRADIPAGYTFAAEGKTLLAREINYVMTKDEGWLISMKGFEQT